MNTMGDDTFDYQAICEKRRRTRRRFGAELLSQQRFDAAMKRLTVRINEGFLQQFSQLAAEVPKEKATNN